MIIHYSIPGSQAYLYLFDEQQVTHGLIEVSTVDLSNKKTLKYTRAAAMSGEFNNKLLENEVAGFVLLSQ